jgi:hypothetical protein
MLKRLNAGEDEPDGRNCVVQLLQNQRTPKPARMERDDIVRRV